MKAVSTVVFALLLMTVLAPASADELYDYVTSPQYTNELLSDFNISDVQQGKSGFVNLTVKNPYNRTMNNITLFAEICCFFPDEGASGEKVYIDRNFSNPPVFASTGHTSFEYHFRSLRPMETNNISMKITVKKETPTGDYGIRFSLDFFNINGTSERHFIMKSKGFFSEEEWNYATKSPENSDLPYYHHGLNTTYLGIDAIIPDTDFSVEEMPSNDGGSAPSIGLPFIAVATVSALLIFRRFGLIS